MKKQPLTVKAKARLGLMPNRTRRKITKQLQVEASEINRRVRRKARLAEFKVRLGSKGPKITLADPTRPVVPPPDRGHGIVGRKLHNWRSAKRGERKGRLSVVRAIR